MMMMIRIPSTISRIKTKTHTSIRSTICSSVASMKRNDNILQNERMIGKKGSASYSTISDNTQNFAPKVDEEQASTKQYAIATTDTALKHLFSFVKGDKDAIHAFLPAFVPSLVTNPIYSIAFCPEAISARHENEDKRSFFLKFEMCTQNDTRYIVEIQSRRQVAYDQLALFDLCATYTNQNSGFRNLKPVIAIQLYDYVTDRGLFPLAEENLYMKSFELSDRNSGEKINSLQMIQVDLSQARSLLMKKNHLQFSVTDWWVELFCFSSEFTDDYIDGLKAKGVTPPAFFEQALNQLDMNGWTPEMLRDYKVDIRNRGGCDEYAISFNERFALGLQIGKILKNITK